MHLNKLYFLNLITSAQYTIAFLTINTAMSFIISNSVYVFSIFTGLYLMSMGIGAFFANQFKGKIKNVLKVIVFNSTYGLFIICPGAIGLILMNEYLFNLFRNTGINYILITKIFGIILSLVNGALAGAELPLFSLYLEDEGDHRADFLNKVLIVDYIGTFLGIFLYTFFLYPFWGVIGSVGLSQFIATLILAPLIIYFARVLRCFSLIFITIVLIIQSLLVYLYREEIIEYIDFLSF